MLEFKKDIKRIFIENEHINSFGWVQYTSVDDFEFKLEEVKINDKEINRYNIKLKLYLSKILSKYNFNFYFNSFGDYCEVKFNRDNSIVVKDYIKI